MTKWVEAAIRLGMTSQDHSRLGISIDALIPGFTSSRDRLGLAVSGGADSLALLLLAHGAFPGRVAAATVDHGWRTESREEAEMVAQVCAERAIPHQILTPPTDRAIERTEAAARAMRYALLETWMVNEGIAWLATAHHADDQLETLLMRLLRGSGVDGLAGIRARRGAIIRPLLGFTKAELVDIVAQAGLSAADDPTNRDPAFDRARIRAALSQLDGFDPTRSNDSAKALDDARAALDWMASELAEQRISAEANGCRFDASGLPDEMLRRLLLLCLRRVDADAAPRGRQLDALRQSLMREETATLGDILCQADGRLWRFTPAPPRRN